MDSMFSAPHMNGHIEHPDRVAWYSSLIEEWTVQAPHVMVAHEGAVAAWVTSYHSQAGLLHAAPTQVWAETIEQALESLATQVYADLQADLAVLATMQQSVQAEGAGMLLRW